MAERPIIFSPSMVRALLDGRKSMTRRRATVRAAWQKVAPGYRLWVREAWRTTDSMDNLSPSDIGKRCLEAGYLGPWAPILYLADNAAMNWESEGRARGEAGRLRAAMHMPRWASRITLAVTAVKVERLQDISEDDARGEGIAPYVPDSAIQQGPNWYRMGFEDLWNSLHGPGAWGVNPWVVVISFRKAE